MAETSDSPADITKEQIENFFLDPLINGKVDKQTQLRIMKHELLSWHPDKSDLTVLPLVYEDQLPLVQQGMRRVTSTLTQLLYDANNPY